jgi:hypothetical protein
MGFRAPLIGRRRSGSLFGGGGRSFRRRGQGGRKKTGEGEASVGRGKEGGDEGSGVGIAEGEEALVFEEAREASQGGFEGADGGQIGRLAGSGEALLDEVEDDEAEEGNFFIQTGDGGGAGVIVQLFGLEFTGVEAVLEGVGVARRGAARAMMGHEKILAQMFCFGKGEMAARGWVRRNTHGWSATYLKASNPML